MSLIQRITFLPKRHGLHIEECGCYKIRRWIMAIMLAEFVVLGLMRTKCPSTTLSQERHTIRFWLVIFNQYMEFAIIERGAIDGSQK